MKKVVKNIEINYDDYGYNQGQPIVLLHGWGQNITMMQPIGDRFQKKHHIIIIDLPGFGTSEEPIEVWSIFDYADAVHELLKDLKIKNPIMIGHSFGGKITLAYASKYEVEKIVLLASPFRPMILKQGMKVKILKLLKKVPLLNGLSETAKKYIGSTDYKNAKGIMRDILVKHVNLDISSSLSNIKAPALLIWGTNDTAVPIEEAETLEKLIPDAGLVTYENATHYAYLERLPQVISVIRVFIES